MKFKEDFLLDNMRYSWKCTLYIDSFFVRPTGACFIISKFFYVLWLWIIWSLSVTATMNGIGLKDNSDTIPISTLTNMQCQTR